MGTIENHNIRSKAIMLSRRQFMNQSAGLFALGSTASGLWRQAARAAEPHRDAPILANLDDTGAPRFAVDYRDLYASLIRRWPDVDTTPILGERKATMILV